MNNASKLSLLDKCPPEQLDQYVNGLINRVCYEEALFYRDYSSAWAFDEWLDVCDALAQLIRSTCDSDQLTLALQAAPRSQKTVTSVVLSRADDLKRAGKERAVVGTAKAALKDFDWSVKMALSSDKLSELQEPLASVSLTLTGGASEQHHAVELNQAEMGELVAALDSASRVVSSFQ